MRTRTSRVRYPARFDRDPDGQIVVQFPDLGGTGISTFGSTLSAARDHAREALTLYLEASFERGFSLDQVPDRLPGGDGWEWVYPESSVVVPILIRHIRTTAGWTQKQAAQRLGVPYTTWQKWEHPAKCNATLSTLEKVAGALGKRLEVAFRG